ncbi:cupin domain-containing protein [Maledivibacter halophilus]|nr:cupin domain-containing protein [Maledivibacter halophilus]
MKGMKSMYNIYRQYPYPINMYNIYGTYPYPYWSPIYNSGFERQFIRLKDYGPKPFVINIEEATKQNNNFRTALWTGDHLQLTLMSIDVGEDIGLEIHPNLDQFLRIEEGEGIVKMGNRKDQLEFQRRVYDDFAIIIPAGTWHNLINTGDKPIKLYSIYAPPQHPYGTVHRTKADAEAAEESYGH